MERGAVLRGDIGVSILSCFSVQTDQITQEGLEEPPAYSPRPDAYTGETTIEYGPSRPFQPAPTQPHQPNSNWLAGPVSPPPQLDLQSPGSLRSLINQITGEIATNLRNSAAAV